MRSWIKNSWLSCQRYTERASQKIDGPLAAWDTVGFFVHHVFCFSCRSFTKRIELIERESTDFAKQIAEREKSTPHDEGGQLSHATLQRIKSAIKTNV